MHACISRGLSPMSQEKHVLFIEGSVAGHFTKNDAIAGEKGRNQKPAQDAQQTIGSRRKSWLEQAAEESVGQVS